MEFDDTEEALSYNSDDLAALVFKALYEVR